MYELMKWRQKTNLCLFTTELKKAFREIRFSKFSYDMNQVFLWSTGVFKLLDGEKRN